MVILLKIWDAGNGGMQEEKFETLSYSIWEGERNGTMDHIGEPKDIYRIR